MLKGFGLGLLAVPVWYGGLLLFQRYPGAALVVLVLLGLVGTIMSPFRRRRRRWRVSLEELGMLLGSGLGVWLTSLLW